MHVSRTNHNNGNYTKCVFAALLLNQYFISIDNVNCVPIGEKRSIWNNNFSDIYAGVLGTDATKPERSVSYEDLLINLLKLFRKLVQTPMVYSNSVSVSSVYFYNILLGIWHLGERKV